MPSRLGHGLYKKIDCLKNIFRCIYINIRSLRYSVVLEGYTNCINDYFIILSRLGQNNLIPYSQKIWWFGDLYYNRQIKIRQNFQLAYNVW